jgi:hypothetical protein
MNAEDGNLSRCGVLWVLLGLESQEHAESLGKNSNAGRARSGKTRHERFYRDGTPTCRSGARLVPHSEVKTLTVHLNVNMATNPGGGEYNGCEPEAMGGRACQKRPVNRIAPGVHVCGAKINRRWFA